MVYWVKKMFENNNNDNKASLFKDIFVPKVETTSRYVQVEETRESIKDVVSYRDVYNHHFRSQLKHLKRRK